VRNSLRWARRATPKLARAFGRGDGSFQAGSSGTAVGTGATARFNSPRGMAIGPDGDLFIGDPVSAAVRRLDGAINVSTFAGVLGQAGVGDGPVAAARFASPGRMAFAPDATLYVVQAPSLAGGGTVRKISADGTTVSTVTAAGPFVGPLTVDAAGTLYYAEYNTGGLYVLPAGAAAATVVIPPGNGIVLGAAPRIRFIDQVHRPDRGARAEAARAEQRSAVAEGDTALNIVGQRSRGTIVPCF